MLNIFKKRELTTYPTGKQRIILLFLVVLANFIAAYEAQIAPVVPLLLEDFNMSLTTYGLITAASVFFGASSAFIFAPLADRYGRVNFLIPSLLLTTFTVFGMALVTSATSLLIMRCLMSFIEGVAVSTTAGLIRDYSPRTGRAMGYAFWTFGPVGSNFFANAIAGWTLPIFVVWESQFIIQGSIALIGSLIVMFWIKDLSPQVRQKIVTDDDHASTINEEIESDDDKVEEQKFKHIFKIPRMWLLPVGISFFLMTYLTIQAYGATFLVQAFGYTDSEAASIAKYFWLFNLFTLVLAGLISDKLRLRKIITMIGAILSVVYIAYFATLVGSEIPITHMMIYTSLLGGFLGIAYGPWMALFSENAEDIRATLQTTAWGIFNFSVRAVAIAVTLIAPVVAAKNGWGTWFWITSIAAVIYIPIVFSAKGPWFKKNKNIH